MDRPHKDPFNPDDLYAALVAALRNPAGDSRPSGSSEPLQTSASAESPTARHGFLPPPLPLPAGRPPAGHASQGETPAKLSESPPAAVVEAPPDDVPAHVAQTSSVAPVALSNGPDERSSSGEESVASGLGSATARRRRLILLGSAAVALTFLGIFGLYESSERAVAAANPRFLWSVDAASAARSLLSIPDRANHEPDRAMSSAPWLGAVGAIPDEHGHLAVRPATISATTALTHITTPITVIVSEPKPTSLDKTASIDHQASSQHHRPAVHDQPPATPSPRSDARSGERGPRASALGPTALGHLDGLPGSMDVEWQEGNRTETPTTERQLQPTRLRANRSPRGSLRGGGGR
jgi:hypothetical protein